MKFLFILATILSIAFAKQAETKAEKFECIAKHLRDKKLLDNEFKFSENSHQLECEKTIAELKEKILRDNLNLASLKEETEDSRASKKLIQENSACIREDLIASEYPEVMMKISVYEVSRNLLMKQRKQLTATTKAEGDKKMRTAILKCIIGPIFSGFFDTLINKEEEQTIENKRIDYCVRKYVIDNSLVDTNELTVNLNPFNIEINFDCEEQLKIAKEAVEEYLKATYVEVFSQCVIKTIMTGNGFDYIAKVFVLSELNLSDDKKIQFRTEFVENFRGLTGEIVKCV